MPRFFIRKNAVFEREDGTKYIEITGSDAHHISRSLRMAVGEDITVCDMQKTEYHCKIFSVTQDVVTADVLSESCSETETPYKAVVYQALVKGDKMDTIIQKSVETGVYKIVPVAAERCIVRITDDAAPKKLERWRKIAEEASKQCGRGIIPEISEPVSFEEAVCRASVSDVPLFCYEGDGTKPIKDILRDIDSIKNLRERNFEVSVIIGPEGGFSIDEADMAEKSGMMMTGLGKRILRTETAASFVLACLVYEYDA